MLIEMKSRSRATITDVSPEHHKRTEGYQVANALLPREFELGSRRDNYKFAEL